MEFKVAGFFAKLKGMAKLAISDSDLKFGSLFLN